MLYQSSAVDVTGSCLTNSCWKYQLPQPEWSVRLALGGPGALNKEEEKEKARGEPQGAIVALLTLQAKRETTGLQEPNKTSQTLQSCSGHVQK
ncbi:hypothetical protein Q7C36_021961 [Tachysurus vachellii]|uniref:Uncharacterized protein n=1 Tax=Tachysurus vachellii TaxID=175792 RepID=A0AA88INY8_TACVA|nr:hypothetical protein Q7C36_021961 [Tachysurus vachellii]